jgi:hypothetical protein
VSFLRTHLEGSGDKIWIIRNIAAKFSSKPAAAVQYVPLKTGKLHIPTIRFFVSPILNPLGRPSPNCAFVVTLILGPVLYREKIHPSPSTTCFTPNGYSSAGYSKCIALGLFVLRTDWPDFCGFGTSRAYTGLIFHVRMDRGRIAALRSGKVGAMEK